jgi:hypothetical protein
MAWHNANSELHQHQQQQQQKKNRSSSSQPASPPAGIHSGSTVQTVHSGNPIAVPLTPITQK